MKILKSRSLVLILIFLSGSLIAQNGKVKQIKLSKFTLQSSYAVSQTGEQLSKSDYKADIYWMPVTVPSTVLTGLVANKIYPDPYLGMNNMLIPDASDEFNKT